MIVIRIEPEEAEVDDWVIYKYADELQPEQIKSITHNIWDKDKCIINDLINLYIDIIIVRV